MRLPYEAPQAFLTSDLVIIDDAALYPTELVAHLSHSGGVALTFARFTPYGGDTGTRTLDPLLAKQVL